MHFKSYFGAGFNAHQRELQIFPGPQGGAEIIIIKVVDSISKTSGLGP
jgi:hypothetical protein